MSQLHLPESRRATFNKTRRGANKHLNWPHVLGKNSTIHPDKLSAAGFYHAPDPSNANITRCFACDACVEDWKEGDDAQERHLEAGAYCPWAIFLASKYPPFQDAARWTEDIWGGEGEWWPNSDKMRKAREESFKSGWPHHDSTTLPTSDEFAAAGWFFTPTSSDPDACACPYCGRSASFWEPEDVPYDAHHKKDGLNCPFFCAPRPNNLVEDEQTDEEDNGIRIVDTPNVSIHVERIPQEKKAAPKTKTKKTKSHSVSASTSQDTLVSESGRNITRTAPVPAPTRRVTRATSVAMSSDNESTAPSTVKSKSSKKTDSSPEVTKKGIPRTQSRRAMKEIVEEPIEEEKPSIPAPTKTTKPSKSKSKSKKGTKAVQEELAVYDKSMADESMVIVDIEGARSSTPAKKITPMSPVRERSISPVSETILNAEATKPKLYPQETAASPSTPVTQVKKPKKKPPKSKVRSDSLEPIGQTKKNDHADTVTTEPESAANKLNQSFLFGSNPFTSKVLPSLTVDEEEMTLEAWYGMWGDRVIDTYKKAMDQEIIDLENRFAEGEAAILKMLQEAEERESRL